MNNLKKEDNYSWNRIECKSGNYLESEILKENGFEHRFFQKTQFSRGPKELIKSMKKDYSIHYTNQIHSNNIEYASRSTERKMQYADGLISDKELQSLWVYTADCLPILFADKKTRIVAACHAGWRGLAQNVLANTIFKLKERGCDKHNIIVALGPSISVDRYEVKEDLIENMVSIQNENNQFKKTNIKDFKSSMKKLGVLKEIEIQNKFFIDISLLAKLLLIQEGLDREKISISNLCTYKEKNLFRSWRREKARNHQWSAICS